MARKKILLPIQKERTVRELPVQRDGRQLYLELPAETKRKIPSDLLDFFPGNATLTGTLPEKKRAELKADILSKGIREDLQVWPLEGRLLVVSGNERLGIVRELSREERRRVGLEDLPCVIKHFDGWSDARNHVATVNGPRKSLNLSPVDRIVKIWPPEESPLLYADLRTRAVRVEVLKLPSGNFKLHAPEDVEALRIRQREMRESVRSVLGWSEAFVAKVINQAVKRMRGDTRDADAPDEKALREMASARREMEKLRPRIKKKEEQLEKLKQELRQMKVRQTGIRKLFAKYGEELPSE